MKFLITGVDGFVGKHLSDRLVEEGHEVFGLSRREHDDSYNTKIKLFIGDINCRDMLDGIFENYKFDGVFNLAGLTHPPTSFIDTVGYFKTNALGSINICDSIQKNNPSCVLMQCSTPEVYGICPGDREIDESFPLRPMNPYGVSKAAADLYILERTRNDAVKAFITRAGSHTGPGRPANYSISSDAIQIAKIIRGEQEPIIKVGNLASQRAVLDVRDIANSYYKLMLSYLNGDIPNGEVFHVSSKNLREIGDYLNIMLDVSNVEATTEIEPKFYRKIDIPVQILNYDKIGKYIDWQPEIPIEQTLIDLVNYWEEELNGS